MFSKKKKAIFMDIKKTMAVAAVSAAAFATSFAETNEDYIKTFGMIVFQNGGLSELKLSPAEFDLFLQGVKDAYAGKELPKNISEFGQKMMEYLKARAEATIAEKAKLAEAEAAKFWKELEKQEGVQKTPSGLAFKVIEKGSDKVANDNSDVSIKYTGKLVNGTVFDSTDKHGKPAEFNLANVIPGFREGLQKVGKGGKVILYIPSNLGYGQQALGSIPPNSTLIFEVEILDVKDAPKEAPKAENKEQKK